MKNWIQERWVDLVFVLAILAASAILASSPVEAKPVAKTVEWTECPIVNMAGTIEIRHCIHEATNFEYYVDSFGFMMPRP